MFATDAEFDESITPDGTQGYHLSLGMREVGSGNWLGDGFSFHQSSNGNFHLVLNTGGGFIQGQSQLADATKLTVNSYKATFNVHQYAAISYRQQQFCRLTIHQCPIYQ